MKIRPCLLFLFSASSYHLASSQECRCKSFGYLPLLTDETFLGSAPWHNLDPCCDGGDDWFSQIYFSEELKDPDMSYRICEYQLTEVFTDTDISSTCNMDAASTPTCTNWKTKKVPDETNFRVFRIQCQGNGLELG
jgi:hypothetical protein